MTPPPQSAAIGTIIAHQDLAPWNLVIGDRWAFIDWDTAAPGTRLWDLAHAVHGFVPLSADPRWRRPDAARRMRVILDAYGLDQTQRHRLLALLAPRTQSMVDLRRARAFRLGVLACEPGVAIPVAAVTPMDARESTPA